MKETNIPQTNTEAEAVAPLSKCLGALPRTNADVVVELAHERREVSANLSRLESAIEANPEGISEHHKDLWRKQAKAMKDYVDVLGERIKDLLG